VLASILARANGMAAAESFLNHKSASSHYTHRPLMEWEVKEVDVYEQIDMFTDSDAATTSFTTICDSMDEEVALQTPHDWDDVVHVDDNHDDMWEIGGVMGDGGANHGVCLSCTGVRWENKAYPSLVTILIMCCPPRKLAILHYSHALYRIIVAYLLSRCD
jgi:hypothetical protein